jgi:hypothetical protein
VLGIDILQGHYVSQTGTVSGHNYYYTTDTDCDDDNHCTTTTTDHYQLIISHENEVTVAEVNVFTYYYRTNGSQVQISYWEGGLVGYKWFVTVSDRKADF